VWGRSGDRDTYRPLDWGISPTAEPLGYIQAVRPRFLYVADLSRITGSGSETGHIMSLATRVERIFVDRGVHSVKELLGGPVTDVIGTETADDLSQYKSGFLSVDMVGGRTIPTGRDPVEVLREADRSAFEGVILLDISGVGTKRGLPVKNLARMRRATEKPLYWGGGVGSCADLSRLAGSGFDGAIISTAVHQGRIPVEYVRSGSFC
jgi:phosphoribosylformimino-5-aminoimidazole carboxamide ribotide isomerase